MEPLNFAPPSPVSPVSEIATPATTRKSKSWERSKSYVSCRTSTGIPRNSFITISSQSITVFADVKDLPSRHGSQHSKPEDAIDDGKNGTRETFNRQSHNSIDSFDSFGFDVTVPEPVYGHVQISAEGLIDQSVNIAQNLQRQTSFRSVWRSKSTIKKQQRLYESFPRPPSKGLFTFATTTVFPEIGQGKQPAYVDKSLPPPPYHAFGKAKKKGIMYLMAIIGVLTPVSTFIYFPVLGDISRVGISLIACNSDLTNSSRHFT
jgi:hypothetical protein